MCSQIHGIPAQYYEFIYDQILHLVVPSRNIINYNRKKRTIYQLYEKNVNNHHYIDMGRLLQLLLLNILCHRAVSFQTVFNRPTTYRLKQSSQDITIEETSEEIIQSDVDVKEMKRLQVKQAILRTLGNTSDKNQKTYDAILADPETKEALYISQLGTNKRPSIIIADETLRNTGKSVTLESEGSSNVYKGRTDTYYNLLSPADAMEENDNNVINSDVENLLRRSIGPFLPRQITKSIIDQDYTPMRDLFTSPFVSFAYERGWRSSFAAAGFPGIDEEAELVRDYFRPAIASNPNNVVVDMSCATGLFTRKLVKSKEYNRVIGCDYSEFMLLEARRRLMAERNIGNVELVQCDVAKIPMQDGVVDALNAGAAMHCWPELQEGLNEIYRVLKPEGRFFASTFLSKYMQNLQVRVSSFIILNLRLT